MEVKSVMWISIRDMVLPIDEELDHMLGQKHTRALYVGLG